MFGQVQGQHEILDYSNQEREIIILQLTSKAHTMDRLLLTQKDFVGRRAHGPQQCQTIDYF